MSKDNWYLTDSGISRVMGELARCGEQFVDILKKNKDITKVLK